MKIRLILYLLCLLASMQGVAQNRLVTHNFIRQKVSEGYFLQRGGTTIPQDEFCISKSEAISWLELDEARLPADNRMPWWSELVPAPQILPCASTNFTVCYKNLEVYNSCGSWLYEPGFSPYMTHFTRSRIGATNPWWNSSVDCGYTPIGTQSSFMLMAGPTATGSGTQDSSAAQGTSAQKSGMITPMANFPKGPFARCGIWSCTDVSNQWLYVNANFAAPETKTYYVGIAANDHFRLYIDGSLIVADEITDPENFRLWHIFPVSLNAGTHSLRVEARDDGDNGAFGCEIYDQTPALLATAVSYNDLRLLFSTVSLGNGTLCVDQPLPERTLYVQNYSVSSNIHEVTGTDGWQLGSMLGPGQTDQGNFHNDYGSLNVGIDAMEACALILEANGIEIHRQYVSFGYQSISLTTPGGTPDLTVRLQPYW